MPNITSILNDQIRRLARREINSGTQVVRRATAHYRRDIAALKRQVAALAKTVAFLEGQEKRRVGEQPVPQEVEGIRFRADGLKSHRAKLGLSADDYGRLVGVTGQTIYDWEAGKSRPRQAQVAKVAGVRGIGKREAWKRLDLLEGTGEKAGAGRRRAIGGQTAQELILSLVRSGQATTTATINEAWSKAGRPGRADNTLTLMVKSGAIKRVNLPGERGSQYR